jgi:hypothetical protein
MGRWDIDDGARLPDRAPTNTVERADTTTRDHHLKVTPLRDDVSPRSPAEIDNERGHGLTLPEGRVRQGVRDQGRIYRMEGAHHGTERWTSPAHAVDGADHRGSEGGKASRGTRVLCDEKGQPLTQKIVQVTIRRVARRAQVKPGVHILRHTFCSHLAMKGAPARAIQELAGHQDLTTTQRYMHLTPAALEAAIGLLNKPNPKRGEIVEAAGNRP